MKHIPFDKEIFALASKVIDTHGREAIKEAAVRANEFEAAGDLETSKKWDHVMHAIVEVNRTWRRDGERCN